MKTAIVTTTINFPVFLLEYKENFDAWKVLPPKNGDDLNFIVVGDNKTPVRSEQLFTWLSQEYGYDWVEYWAPDKQRVWLETFYPKKDLSMVIPENDMRRRNFGYLRALQWGADVIVTIDDDNYPFAGVNWLKAHLDGLEDSGEMVSSENYVVNPCAILESNFHIYSRGYPVEKMFTDTFFYRSQPREYSFQKVVLNMGLWLGKPDVDSFFNVCYPSLYSNGKSNQYGNIHTVDNSYFPINTQNTAFRKELSIFHNLYQEPLLGLPSHRYDDIWMGLIAQRLAHAMGDTMSFGMPVVEHRRNSHDYVKDLQTEFVGIALNCKMWQTIMNMDIESKDYKSGFVEISEKLPKAKMFNNNAIVKFIDRMCESMRLWVDLIEVVE